MRSLAVMGILCAVSATSFAAIGDTAWWYPSRDWSNRAGDPGGSPPPPEGNGWGNAGQAASFRVFKASAQEFFMFDLESWENPTQPRTQKSMLTGWTAAHPLDPANYYDYFKWELDTCCSTGTNGLDAYDWGGKITRVQWRTVEMTNDWAEGSGWQFQSAGCANFDWPAAEKAATDWYAQTAYCLDGAGLPVVDTANSVPWTSRTGVVRPRMQGGDYLTSANSIFNVANSAYTVVDGTSAAYNANPQIHHVRTEIDQAIMDDIFNNPNNRGLAATNLEVWNPATSAWEAKGDQNSSFFSMDRSMYLDAPLNQYLWNYNGNATQGPRFYVTIAEKPLHGGDATKDGHVNVDDLGILATNYDGTGKVWIEADFTGDGIVNVDDLGILATEYDWVGPGASVPEPASLSLLALGALALIRRKK